LPTARAKHRRPRLPELFPETAFALLIRRGILEARDIRNAPMPRLGQKIGRQAPAGKIVRGHRTRTGQPADPVQINHRDASLGTFAGQGRRQHRRGENDAIDLISENFLHQQVRIGSFGHEKQDVIALFLELPRQLLEDHRIKLILQVGHDQPDDFRAPGAERPRNRVRPVTQFFRRRQHLLPR